MSLHVLAQKHPKNPWKHSIWSIVLGPGGSISWPTKRVPSALTPIGQLYQSPPSPFQGTQDGIIPSLTTQVGGSGMRYLKAIDYISMSQCTQAIRLTRESKVDPRQPRKGEKKSAHLLFLSLQNTYPTSPPPPNPPNPPKKSPSGRVVMLVGRGNK